MRRNRHDHDDGGWGLVSSAIGLLLAGSLATNVLVWLAHALPGVLVVGLVILLVVGLAQAPGRPWAASRLRFPFPGRPRPLGGEARWASLADLRRAGWRSGQGWPIGVYRACWGVLRCRVVIPDEAQTMGTLILAPTGQGKTDSVLVPIVRSMAAIVTDDRRPSMILLDPKGDVVEKSRDALCRMGPSATAPFDLHVWNPSDPTRSTIAIDLMRTIPDDVTDPHYQEACDLLAVAYLAATYSDETGATSTYVADPYWQKQVASIFKGLLLYLKGFNPQLTLLDLAQYLADVTPEEMVRHLTTHPRTKAAALRGASFRELLLNERARGAVAGDLIERASILTDSRLERVMVPGPLPAFDVDAFLDRPTVLALQVGALGDPMLPLLSVVLATIQNELVRRTRGGQRLRRGVRIIVDEAGVIGRINGLDTGVAMLRSANVGYVLALQTTDQLRANYGRERAETILANLTHRLVLGGTTDHDADWVCTHLGRRNAYRDLLSTTGAGDDSHHYTREEWPLVRPDQLRHMRFQMVVDSSDVPPTRLHLRPYTQGQ